MVSCGFRRRSYDQEIRWPECVSILSLHQNDYATTDLVFIASDDGCLQSLSKIQVDFERHSSSKQPLWHVIVYKTTAIGHDANNRTEFFVPFKFIGMPHSETEEDFHTHYQPANELLAAIHAVTIRR